MIYNDHGISWRHPTTTYGNGRPKTIDNKYEAMCGFCNQWRNAKKGGCFLDGVGTAWFCCGKCSHTKAFKELGFRLTPWRDFRG